MNKESKVYIAGHRGMVGSAVWRALESKGYTNLIGKTFEDLDLRDQNAVNDFYNCEQPQAVIPSSNNSSALSTLKGDCNVRPCPVADLS